MKYILYWLPQEKPVGKRQLYQLILLLDQPVRSASNKSRKKQEKGSYAMITNGSQYCFKNFFPLFSLRSLICFSAKDVAIFFHPLGHRSFKVVAYFDTVPATTAL